MHFQSVIFVTHGMFGVFSHILMFFDFFLE